MSPPTAKLEKGYAAQRRHTVRIIKHRTLSRPAVISLAVTGGAALCVLALWRFWQHEDVVRPRQRSLIEWETDWKCDSGHTFRAAGQIEPRSCWTCGKPAYPVTHYECPVHGTYEVSARFTTGADGAPKVAFLRLRGGPWIAVEEGLRCPQCSSPLQYVGNDPLRALGMYKSTGGG